MAIDRHPGRRMARLGQWSWDAMLCHDFFEFNSGVSPVGFRMNLFGATFYPIFTWAWQQTGEGHEQMASPLARCRGMSWRTRRRCPPVLPTPEVDWMFKRSNWRIWRVFDSFWQKVAPCVRSYKSSSLMHRGRLDNRYVSTLAHRDRGRQHSADLDRSRYLLPSWTVADVDGCCLLHLQAFPLILLSFFVCCTICI